MSEAYNSIADLYVDRYRGNKGNLVHQDKPRSRKIFLKIIVSIIIISVVYSLKYSENKNFIKIYEVINKQVILTHMDTELIYDNANAMISQAIEQIKSRVSNVQKD